MKCQKCSKQSVVHLTEVVPDDHGAGKHAVEIHLCLGHAVEAGLVVASPEMPQVMASQVPMTDLGKSGDELPKAIVPKPPEESGLTVLGGGRGATGNEATRCPICGTDWNQFKQSGVMGCPHDYELFSARIVPLLKRAQEGAAEHVGKMPRGNKTQDAEKQVATLRLTRALQKALHAENYEEAAQLRDKLRGLEQN